MRAIIGVAGYAILDQIWKNCVLDLERWRLDLECLVVY